MDKWDCIGVCRIRDWVGHGEMRWPVSELPSLSQKVSYSHVRKESRGEERNEEGKEDE